ncbi:MAG: two-component system chemotaxis sensor kinase CheA, partial [Pirellulaceae bacterium]
MNSTTIENNWGAVDPQILEKMHSEAKTRLTSAAAAMVVFTANRSHSNVHRVFREFHTLKSVAGFMQLDVAVRLAHDAEDVLEQVRRGNIEATDDLLQVLQDYLQA